MNTPFGDNNKVVEEPEVASEPKTLEDLPQLVKDEQWYEALGVIRIAGIDIKYGPMNNTRKRAELNELRQLAYNIQRDMRACSQDTSVCRDIIKGLSTGSSY